MSWEDDEEMYASEQRAIDRHYEEIGRLLDIAIETADPKSIDDAMEVLQYLLPKSDYADEILRRLKMLFRLSASAQKGGEQTAEKKRFPSHRYGPECGQFIRDNITKSASWLYAQLSKKTGYSEATMRRYFESFIRQEKKKTQK